MDSFFGIGFAELFLIAVVALVVLGPERLPETMRTLAKFLKQLRALYNELISQFDTEIKVLDDINPQKLLKELVDQLDDEGNKTPKSDAKRSASPPVVATKRAAAPVTPKAVTPSPVTVAEDGANGIFDIHADSKRHEPTTSEVG